MSPSVNRFLHLQDPAASYNLLNIALLNIVLFYPLSLVKSTFIHAMFKHNFSP
ncbi:hypothetical protein DSOL_3399 [Desulfosporosinus metallidurans]|uniref:Uncharacterized protein n=1 Tax=Desulfosporosinus metallidurans TaxID=1888891 RepID=A0A1Q8QQR4_9FIRM|nr:hypothetical protein DSOL_3399 [Desulfosporosinus metallidurans]